MKKLILPGSIAVICWLAFTIMPRAQVGTPEFDPLGEHNNLPKLIQVQVEFIEVSHEQFTGLMASPRGSTNDGELRKQVAQLVKEGKGTIVETMMCTARSGQRATSESIKEHIYATEYEPPTLEMSVGADGVPPKADHREPATAPTPTAFETRNVGSTLEIEPTLGEDDRTIDLRFMPEIVHHVGDEILSEWKDEHGTVPIKMPKFYSIRLNTSVVLINGQCLMAGALSQKDKDGLPDLSRKLMVFVRADVLTAGH